MQQISQITKGIYSRVSEPAVLLQSLITYHLADDSARELLATIPQTMVDGRGICFNSKQTVDIGEFGFLDSSYFLERYFRTGSYDLFEILGHNLTCYAALCSRASFFDFRFITGNYRFLENGSIFFIFTEYYPKIKESKKSSNMKFDAAKGSNYTSLLSFNLSSVITLKLGKTLPVIFDVFFRETNNFW